MLNHKEEKRLFDDLAEATIKATPRIVQAVIEARQPASIVALRKERLNAAILLTRTLLADLEKSRAHLGWNDPRSDAA